MEEAKEYNIEIYMLFADFQQAFDRVNRKKVYNAMREIKNSKKN